ncbi:DUF1758 domain-containing protein [Trichonephila clavipes]|nr:DUF1758 domain-containing protein [Trichonephila clavipes]
MVSGERSPGIEDSVFGYIVGGSVEDEPNLYSCGLICGSEELNSNLRKFWGNEEIDNELPKNLENSISLVVFRELKDIALKRLIAGLACLETRITKKLYDFERIRRASKEHDKIAYSINASALTANGRSLNSIQYNGGVIQDDLFSLLVRKHIYAFTEDIRQMYRMIDVDVQRPLQRILWKGDVNEPVKGENFPLAASVLCDDFYMDDVLSGANSLEVAKTLQHQLIDILQTAQMSLHKWCGNTSELIPTTEKEYDFASRRRLKP